MNGASFGTLGFPTPSQQPHQQQQQPKVLVVWSEGKTSTVRADNENVEGGQKDADWKPLPFQYQVPINKYSTLHNIAAKRSTFKRGQKDLENHRTTIVIPKYERFLVLLLSISLVSVSRRDGDCIVQWIRSCLCI